MCASQLIDFGDDNGITIHDDCQLEAAAECWEDDELGNNLTHKSLINLAQRNMEIGEPIRVNVRRKTLWEDFVKERKRKAKPEKLLKVVFIGEPAIDDGGPRREFLSGSTIIFELFITLLIILLVYPKVPVFYNFSRTVSVLYLYEINYVYTSRSAGIFRTQILFKWLAH